jgi:hypothetical protein
VQLLGSPDSRQASGIFRRILSRPPVLGCVSPVSALNHIVSSGCHASLTDTRLSFAVLLMRKLGLECEETCLKPHSQLSGRGRPPPQPPGLTDPNFCLPFPASSFLCSGCLSVSRARPRENTDCDVHVAAMRLTQVQSCPQVGDPTT